MKIAFSVPGGHGQWLSGEREAKLLSVRRDGLRKEGCRYGDLNGRCFDQAHFRSVLSFQELCKPTESIYCCLYVLEGHPPELWQPIRDHNPGGEVTVPLPVGTQPG